MESSENETSARRKVRSPKGFPRSIIGSPISNASLFSSARQVAFVLLLSVSPWFLGVPVVEIWVVRGVYNLHK